MLYVEVKLGFGVFFIIAVLLLFVFWLIGASGHLLVKYICKLVCDRLHMYCQCGKN